MSFIQHRVLSRRAGSQNLDLKWVFEQNPLACRRVWILLFLSCTTLYLFVVFLPLSRHFPWRGFFASSNLNPPPYPSPQPSFRFHPSLRCAGLNSAHASLNTDLVLRILLSFPWLFPSFLLCWPSVCSVALYIQYLIHWLLCRTPFVG